jgi:hypothetical protein
MVHLPYSASLQILYLTIQNALAANSERSGCKSRSSQAACEDLGQAIDLISMSRQSIEAAANVNYVPLLSKSRRSVAIW